MNSIIEDIKRQITVPDELMLKTIEAIKTKRNQKAAGIRKEILFAAVITVMILLTAAAAFPLIRDRDNIYGKETKTTAPIENVMSYNRGVMISPSLMNAISAAEKNEIIKVKITITEMPEKYEESYRNALYDGKTYEEWWAEYESINKRLIGIREELKEKPDNELQAEYNKYAEDAEKLDKYLSGIRTNRRVESFKKEAEEFCKFGIKAEYSGGYILAEMTPEQLKNIEREDGAFYFDTLEVSFDPDDEIQIPH